MTDDRVREIGHYVVIGALALLVLFCFFDYLRRDRLRRETCIEAGDRVVVAEHGGDGWTCVQVDHD